MEFYENKLFILEESQLQKSINIEEEYFIVAFKIILYDSNIAVAHYSLK